MSVRCDWMPVEGTGRGIRGGGDEQKKKKEGVQATRPAGSMGPRGLSRVTCYSYHLGNHPNLVQAFRITETEQGPTKTLWGQHKAIILLKQSSRFAYRNQRRIAGWARRSDKQFDEVAQA